MKKKQPTGRTVLLFSGGLDSVCIAGLMQPDVLLRVPTNSDYDMREAVKAGELAQRYFPNSYYNVAPLIDLHPFERPDHIVPLRNLYMVTHAAQYGETIWLGAVEGDRTLDKSKPFIHMATEMLNFLMQNQHWCERHRYLVLLPVKHMTKRELVSWYVESRLDTRALTESWSCYKSTTLACGDCKPCIRRWVALTLNGVDPGVYDSNPQTSRTLINMRAAAAEGAGNYRGREDADLLEVA